MSTTLLERTHPRGNLGPPPDRSLAQRRAALDIANEVRTLRGDLKRDIKARRVHAAAVLLDPPDWLGTMKVMELLLSVPKYGRVRVTNLLSRKEISLVKTVGGLSPRQRKELVAALGYEPQGVVWGGGRKAAEEGGERGLVGEPAESGRSGREVGPGAGESEA
jgi:hypothetical protein